MPVEHNVLAEDKTGGLTSIFSLLSYRAFNWFVGVLVVYVIVRGIVAASQKPFFFDEIITLAIASQANVRNIWNSLVQSVDSHPPLFYLVERLSSAIFHNPQIALRMPSILAFPCIAVCVFVYLRARCSAPVSFLCTVLLLLTSLFSNYAINARGYSMVIACIALGLVSYQRIPSTFWSVMLAISLALAEALHYYAIFSMLPFAMAEAFYFLRRRKFRWQVWLALGFGAVPLALCWHLLVNFRSYYGPHIWAHAGLSSLPLLYGAFFSVGSPFGFAVAVMCAAGVIGARFLPAPETNSLASKDQDNLVEGVLLLGLLSEPFTTLAITQARHGILLDRYVLGLFLVWL
jgi:4-amino-4-deoxy-L-arabinose transferase-like glycosyltransferase